MATVHRRACHLCEAICGLKITVEDGSITSIKGDPDDPLSRGHICPKAIALQDLHNDPDRLREPVRRQVDENGDISWQAISWEQALDETARKLVDTHSEYGVNAIGAYFGNPSVHNYGMLTHQKALFGHFQTRNRFSATSVDQLPHHLTSLWLFGHKSLFPIPDIDRSEYFLMLGANPMASNGSIWTVPDIKKRIKGLRKRGGKLVVIDPRHTETAALADQHLFIKPGTDALLLLAILNTLFEDKLADTRHLTPYVVGLERVAAAITDFSAERASQHCGIDADCIREIARDFAAADAAICYGRMGVSTQVHGLLCQWLIQIINIATGNLDREGGSLFTLPAVDQVANAGRGGFARHHSRVRGLPEFDRELPASTLAEEILTPGDDQIRSLFTGAGNPVLSTPNGAQLDRALDSLDFMVSLDPYINETTRHAHIILPPTSALEHDHYDIAFHINAVRNTARMNEAVFDKPENSLHDWEIFNALGERVAALLGRESRTLPEPAMMIAAGLEMGPYGSQQGHPLQLTLEQLRESESGVDLGPLQPQLPERLFTPDHKIHCDTELALADLDRLRDSLETTETGLLLIGRRHVRSNNSWMHNYHRLIKGKDRCTAMIHPQDLSAHGLNDGDWVTVSSRTGEVRLRAEASEDLMPGVISIPHGWGHHRKGVRGAIATANAGVSCNDLTDELLLDDVCGNAAVNGVPVTIAATVPATRPETIAETSPETIAEA